MNNIPTKILLIYGAWLMRNLSHVIVPNPKMAHLKGKTIWAILDSACLLSNVDCLCHSLFGSFWGIPRSVSFKLCSVKFQLLLPIHFHQKACCSHLKWLVMVHELSLGEHELLLVAGEYWILSSSFLKIKRNSRIASKKRRKRFQHTFLFSSA